MLKMDEQIMLPQEEVQRSISAAFDSVNLINSINAKAELTEEDEDTLDRNVRHLQIMLEKSWFADGLTTEQRQAIDAVI